MKELWPSEDSTKNQNLHRKIPKQVDLGVDLPREVDLGVDLPRVVDLGFDLSVDLPPDFF